MRTRFAPSPTGYLHIGGVRTALFNWLLTRRLGGQFILRIDDTDAERNRPEALQPILDGFRWLGIDWDEGPEVGGPYGPYFQSQRNQLYVDAAMKLLASGHAYPDYMTKDQLEAAKKAADAAKKPYIHRGPERDWSAAMCQSKYAAQPVALRLKVPTGQKVAIKDLICGPVEWDTDTIGDPVILRPPGPDGQVRPLYNFATVVDDVAMKITHVIRAKEHLSNTPTQVLVYQAMSVPVPEFAHVPVVNAPPPRSNEKLSKRKMAQFMTPEVVAKLRAVHAVPADWADEDIKTQECLNPATVAFYEALGYLPAGVVNYLGRLGWSLDDKSEIIPLDQMIANFSLDRVNIAPASFDQKKLLWVSAEYMKTLPLEDKVKGVIPFLQRAGLIGETVDEPLRGKIGRVMEAFGDRIKLFSDALTMAAPFFRPDPEYDRKAVSKHLGKEGMPAHLREFREHLAVVEPFSTAALESLLAHFAAEKGINPPELMNALRVSTTGLEVGPGAYDCLTILGREESLRRIDLALTEVSG
jgi:glutamyl-tRNA synthetase